MQNIKQIMIGPQGIIREAVVILENHPAKIVLVIGENDKLLGTITDGDVRRAILAGLSLEDSVSKVMNASPIVGHFLDDKQHLLNMMVDGVLRHVPILDDVGNLVGIETLNDLLHHEKISNTAVIMAGGRGKRLRPLTDTIPKPMVPVAGKPMLEMVIDRLSDHGFQKIIISLNYKGNIISDYFGDGSSRGLEIKYVTEDEPLGTAGALSLIEEEIKEPFLVMNGDVLTQVNSRNLLDFHQAHPCAATMCVREYQQEIPFGVVEIDGHKIIKVVEKPVSSFMVNAGIYLLDPSVLSFVNKNEYLDMPTLFERIQKSGNKTHVFPILEAWRDVGRHEDLTLAIKDHS